MEWIGLIPVLPWIAAVAVAVPALYTLYLDIRTWLGER